MQIVISSLSFSFDRPLAHFEAQYDAKFRHTSHVARTQQLSVSFSVVDCKALIDKHAFGDREALSISTSMQARESIKSSESAGIE